MPSRPRAGIGWGSGWGSEINQPHRPGAYVPNALSLADREAIKSGVWGSQAIILHIPTICPVGRSNGEAMPPRSSDDWKGSRERSAASSGLTRLDAWMPRTPRNLICQDLVSTCFSPSATRDAQGCLKEMHRIWGPQALLITISLDRTFDPAAARHDPLEFCLYFILPD